MIILSKKLLLLLAICCVGNQSFAMKRLLEDSSEICQTKRKKVETISLFTILSQGGNFLELKKAIESGFVDVNEQEEQMPFIFCLGNNLRFSQKEKNQLFRLLVENGAILTFSVPYQFLSKKSVTQVDLCWLLDNKNFYELWLAIVNGANVSQQIAYGENRDSRPFFISLLHNGGLTERARFAWFDLMVKYDLDVNIANSSGANLLMNKVLDGSIEWVEKLLRAGANPNLTDKEGYSCFHFACITAANCEEELMKVLLADMPCNCDNDVCLEFDEIYKKLLRKVEQRRKILDMIYRVAASQIRHWPLLNEHTKEKSEQNDEDFLIEGKDTPLHFAALSESITRFLILRGADPLLKNVYEQTPYQANHEELDIVVRGLDVQEDKVQRRMSKCQAGCLKNLKDSESIRDKIILPALKPQIGNVVSFVHNREKGGPRLMLPRD